MNQRAAQAYGPAAPPESLPDVTREVMRLASGGTARRPTVLVMSDGSSVLSRGDLGPGAVHPVLRRKCDVVEDATGMRAVPLAFERAEPAELVRALELLRPNFDAILLVDIAAPHCFELQRLLADSLLRCPVLHDDEQGTAVMTAAAARMSALRAGRKLDELCAVVVGAGAAGSSTARLLYHLGVGELRVVDSQGILYPGRPGLTAEKAELASLANRVGLRGSLATALRGADLCVALSGRPIPAADLAGMNAGPIIIPLSYPDVEVCRGDAAALGAMYLPALENHLSNNLATPGLLLAAHELGLHRLDLADLECAVECLTSMSESQSAPALLPRVDAAPLARSIARAVAGHRDTDHDDAGRRGAQ